MPPAQMDDMEIATNKSMAQRLCNFVVALGVAVLFVYVFLPYLTRSFGVLNRMSQYLDDNGIDPSRYYYTDVEQVQEAEQYLDSVLELD
ncbi:hypothetical protein [Desulfopila aestuarii]|uniref:Uncharacterized protein n=1 Tax=Desulfopila aestuarii DSM 18488 TaxID=1121416 RepID=A0A1M7YFA7_9BACT|nr:hypothetical protein [Desulfopila aestuarii]SHO51300.1 hypothetical protein SAMN02745220_03942 [Desulfopila aestuarii DSM 18488]